MLDSAPVVSQHKQETVLLERFPLSDWNDLMICDTGKFETFGVAGQAQVAHGALMDLQTFLRGNREPKTQTHQRKGFCLDFTSHQR